MWLTPPNEKKRHAVVGILYGSYLWRCSLAVPVLPGGFMVFVVLCPGKPEGSIGSAFGLKASQKTGKRLKSSVRVRHNELLSWLRYHVLNNSAKY